MTRIAGLISLGLRAGELDRPTVERMARAQLHRDFSSPRIDELGPASIAFAGFSDGNPANERAQHASDPEQQTRVYVDGAIYNRGALAKLVDATARQPARVATVADIVLAAYQKWGMRCFQRLCGHFAIVVVDRRNELILLARDQVGAKPLSYTVVGDRLAFASEIKPLLELRPGCALNQRALLEFMLHSDVLAPGTLFEGIEVVPPGHVLVVDGKSRSPVLQRYHRGADEVDEALYHRYARGDPAGFLDDLDARLRASVAECMQDLGPVGVALSGGVDSSIITAMASRLGEITALHVSVPQVRQLDERSAAETVAKHVHVPIDVLPMSGETYRRELARATYANEMPMWHMQCVAFYLLARRARELGMRCLLSGDTVGALLGADDGRHLFWRNYRALFAAAAALPVKLTRFAQKAGYAFGELPLSSPGFTLYAPMTVQLVDGYARASLMQQGEEVYRFVTDSAHRRIYGVKLADLSQALNRFFHRGDRLPMASGVENRNPFGDTAALRLSLNMPMSLNVRGGGAKWSLKELATRYLPRKLAFRKKVAWDLPAGLYLRGLASPLLFRDGFCAQTFHLSEEAVRRYVDSWLRDVNSLARMVHTEVWGRLFFMNQSIDQVTQLIEECERASDRNTPPEHGRA